MSKTLSDFRGFYETQLLSKLKALDATRREALNFLLRFGSIVLGIGIVVEILLYIANSSGKLEETWLWLLSVLNIIAVIAVVGIPYSKKNKKYLDTFKAAVIGEIIRWLADGLGYDPYKRISDNDFNASRIYGHKPDRSSGSDFVHGTVDKTWIRFSLLHTEYETTTTDKDGHEQSEWHTIFNGIFFVGDFNKHFKGHTLVSPASSNRIARALATPLFGGGQKVSMENPEFEKRFQVLASDQVEARYILSTSLMERLLNFVDKANNEVKISFVGSCVCIAISSGSRLFEPRYFRSIVDYSACERYFLFLSLTIGIVEDLNLNLRIWTKQ